PDDLRPSEASLFAIPGDESVRWAGLLTWHGRRGPNADERAALDALGREQIDERTYLIGDLGLATPVRVSMAAGTSLSDDAERRDALRGMAGLHGVQVFADPAELLRGTVSGDQLTS